MEQDESVQEIEAINGGSLSYDEKINFTNQIAQPMASEKLARRLFKLIRKAKRQKKTDCSIKSILKVIEKKSAQGILVIAGDVSPVDAVSHVPIVCEDHEIPYCYVPSRSDLVANFESSLPLCAVFVQRDDSYADLYDKCSGAVGALPLPI